MKCRKCKSENVSLRMLQGPSQTRYKRQGWGFWWIVCTMGLCLMFPRRKVKVKTTAFKKIAFCKDCGYSWTVKAKHRA